MRYFYIITRDKQIFEFEYSEERIENAVKEWQKGGLLRCEGCIFSCADITKILDPKQYENYIYQSKPRMWIKDGTWYDENGFIKNEEWKQKKVNELKSRSLPTEEKPVSKEEIKRLIEKYTPDFLRKTKI